MKMDEYVPTRIPMRSVVANALIPSPPKKNRIITTISVVKDVTIVRESTSFIL